MQVSGACPYESLSFEIAARNDNTSSGSETWGTVDVAKEPFAIRQVAMARLGHTLSVTVVISNSLDEHLQETNTIGEGSHENDLLMCSIISSSISYA